MDFVIELTIPCTAHISSCFFGTYHLHISTVATNGVHKIFCMCLLERPYSER